MSSIYSCMVSMEFCPDALESPRSVAEIETAPRGFYPMLPYTRNTRVQGHEKALISPFRSGALSACHYVRQAIPL